MSLQRIEGWRDLNPDKQGGVIALGNFDGVHRGHQAVIAEALGVARRLDAPLGVIGFQPHPRRWFQPEAEPFLLMTPGQQDRALAALGADRHHLLAFDADMAGMSDEAFARDVLARGLGARHVTVGFDITFGKGRTGSPEALSRYGEQYGFSVSVVAPVTDPDGAKLSSSAVREALKAGDPAGAAAILGRSFAIEGEVVHGDKRGRELGVPTANVRLGDYLRPAFGVYATRSRLPDGRSLPGVSNLGIRPMFETPEPLLEVWLFDFAGDLYGQVIETELVAFLRPEMRLDGLEALKRQIAEDAARARRLLDQDAAVA